MEDLETKIRKRRLNTIGDYIKTEPKNYNTFVYTHLKHFVSRLLTCSNVVS